MPCGRNLISRRLHRLGQPFGGLGLSSSSPSIQHARGLISPAQSPHLTSKLFRVRPTVGTHTVAPTKVQRVALSSDGCQDATIFALSTAPGKAAIAVVRCSGPACSKVRDQSTTCISLDKRPYTKTLTRYIKHYVHPSHPQTLAEPRCAGYTHQQIPLFWTLEL